MRSSLKIIALSVKSVLRNFFYVIANVLKFLIVLQEM